MSFREEMEDGFSEALENFEDAIIYDGHEVSAIVGVFTESEENIRGGRRKTLIGRVHLKESDRVSLGIEKGARVEIPSLSIKCRVMDVEHLSGAQRTLACESVHQT